MSKEDIITPMLEMERQGFNESPCDRVRAFHAISSLRGQHWTEGLHLLLKVRKMSMVFWFMAKTLSSNCQNHWTVCCCSTKASRCFSSVFPGLPEVFCHPHSRMCLTLPYVFSFHSPCLSYLHSFSVLSLLSPRCPELFP